MYHFGYSWYRLPNPDHSSHFLPGHIKYCISHGKHHCLHQRLQSTAIGLLENETQDQVSQHTANVHEHLADHIRQLTLCLRLPLGAGFSAAAAAVWRLGFEAVSLWSGLAGAAWSELWPGTLDSKSRSIFTQRFFRFSWSRRGERSSVCMTGMGEKVGSSLLMDKLLLLLLLLPLIKVLRVRLAPHVSLDLAVLPPGAIQGGRTLICRVSSWSVLESDVDESVSMNSRDFGTILPGPLYFFFSEAKGMLGLGSFLGMGLWAVALLRPLGGSGSSTLSFSLGVLLVIFGLGQVNSSMLVFFSTFLGCFFPIVLWETVSIVADNLCFKAFVSGFFWVGRGRAFSLMRLRRGLSLGSAKTWLGLVFTLTWTSIGWMIGGGTDIVSMGVSFWPQINDLFWDVTLLSHLSNCHLLVEGGSGCRLRNSSKNEFDIWEEFRRPLGALAVCWWKLWMLSDHTFTNTYT